MHRLAAAARIGGVLGVAKEYTTRVARGPLPRSLGLAADRREKRQEYARHGTPRGRWYDAVVVRTSTNQRNGCDCLNKLDVLDGLPESSLHGVRDKRRHIKEFRRTCRARRAALLRAQPGW